MATEKPNYKIGRFENNSTFSRTQLEQVLDAIPIKVNVVEGHDLSMEPRDYDDKVNPTLMVDYLGAQNISLKPPEGYRLADAHMSGPLAKKFHPTRIMDEDTGNGACCSYHANTKELGLYIDVDFSFDIYKLG